MLKPDEYEITREERVHPPAENEWTRVTYWVKVDGKGYPFGELGSAESAVRSSEDKAEFKRSYGATRECTHQTDPTLA